MTLCRWTAPTSWASRISIAAICLLLGCGKDEPDPNGEGGSQGGFDDGGVVDSGSETGDDVDCAAQLDPGPAPLRRLSRVEYGNTIYQLFGDTKTQRLGLDTLVADGKVHGFSNQASVVSTSPLLASRYLENAEVLADANVDRYLSGMSGCTAGTLSEACLVQVRIWAATFGQRVYRRPLEEAELAAHVDLFTVTAAQSDARTGLVQTMAMMLQSPHFLYKVETGAGLPVAEGVVALTSWEMASRLS